MLNTLASTMDLSPTITLIAIGVAFLAGLVRGFSGFALSAIVMACLAPIIPPVSLIPVCWMLELSASVLMLRAGVKEANINIAMGLWIGGLIGTPIGLMLTTTLDVSTSKMIALILIIILALTQIAKVRLPFLATKPGLYGTGVAGGVVTGLASIGGMITALYVLAADLPSRIMRATLVVYLFIGSATFALFIWWFGMFTETTFTRGAILIVPTMLGVAMGKLFFNPTLERFYKPFCLSLLVGLAILGVVRTAL